MKIRMKLLFLLISLMTVVAVFSIDVNSDIQRLWNQFKEKHNKKYNSTQEETHRIRAFIQNHINVRRHNEQLFKKFTFSMGLTSFSDLTDEEFGINVCNCLIPSEKSSTSDLKLFESDLLKELLDTEVPYEKDWVQSGAVSLPIVNQDDCLSCWSFATIGVAEGLWFRKTGKLIRLSAQEVLDCDSGSCNGGNLFDAFSSLANRIILVPEDEYPYEGKKGVCRNHTRQGVIIEKFNQICYGTEEDLKRVVAKYGPTAVGFHATKNLKLFKGKGVYYDKNCYKKQPNHAMLVVGYGTTNKGEDFWLLKNSWGPEWGDRGFFKSARNKNNHCGIAEDMVYALS